jgi:hypothetical protein
VERQSSLGKKPRTTLTPSHNPANIAERCEMLLSPGTSISQFKADARVILQSIKFKPEH